ncbi:MAG: T9SS type A sorting domain-containing protein [Janthinobacterium lividum]
MRNPYYLLATAFALLAAPRAYAQQPWQPFRPALTYQFDEAATPGDTTHTLRLGAGTLVPGTTTDSLFQFTGRVGKLVGPYSTSNCNGTQRLRPDNLFGATLRSQPKAVFTLAAANGHTLTLRPRAALGVSWATGLPGLTASVTSRGVASVLGSPADSVVTIQFSDGEIVRLSKQAGWLEGPSLDSYLNGRNRRRHLTLTALPERHLGTAVMGALAVFDYQPGDYFQRHRRSYSGFGQFLCQEGWLQDSVLTRQTSRTGDTLTYTIRTRSRYLGYGSVGSPFCSTPSVVTTYASTSTLVVIGSKAEDNGYQKLTGFYSGPINGTGEWTSTVSRNNVRFGGRPEYSQSFLKTCSTSSADSVTMYVIADGGRIDRYAAGLGLTYLASLSDFMELTAFRKGSQTWGTFFAKGFLLATRAERAAATTSAFPNPFDDGLTASFTLTRTQAVAATLHDVLGRAVRTTTTGALPAGAQQLVLPTAGLPAGVYTLHLHFVGDDRTEVLRVVKAE